MDVILIVAGGLAFVALMAFMAGYLNLADRLSRGSDTRLGLILIFTPIIVGIIVAAIVSN
jgi:uncharacterized membrane protein (DUF485 family)